MGPFSRERDLTLSRWTNDGGQNWTPDQRLDLEKGAKPRHDGGRSLSYRLKCALAIPLGQPGSASARTEPLSARSGGGKVDRGARADVRSGRSPNNSTSPSDAAAPLPKSASCWRRRVGIGFIQGAALALLLLAPDRGIWPGSKSTLSAALIPAAVAAPAETASEPRVVLDIAPEPPRPVAVPKPSASTPRQQPKAEPEPPGDIMMHTAGEFPVELLAQNWSRTDAAPCITKASIPCDVWFLDLDGDGRDEMLFAYGDGPRVKADVMRRGRSRWVEAAAAASPPCPGLLSRVRHQDGSLLPGWRKALRAGLRQRPGAPPVELPCPRP